MTTVHTKSPSSISMGDNAFHSRLHNSDGSIADSTIGKPATSGCVRMYDDDIYYILNFANKLH